MKKLAYLLLFLVSIVSVQAQIVNPAKWKSKIEKLSETEYVITLDGTVEGDWHMYSQFTAEGGPLPAELLFNNEKGNYVIAEKAKESTTKTVYNDVFEVDETYFDGPVQLVQKVKLTNSDLKTIQLELSYQVCLDVCISQSNFF